MAENQLTGSDRSTAAPSQKTPESNARTGSATRGLFSDATIELHTGQAARIWAGTQTAVNAIGVRPNGAVSVMIAAGALRYCWMATGDDNPWADFALLRFEARLALVHDECHQRIAGAQEVFRRLADMGMRVPLVARTTVERFQLTAYTPYHGMLLETFGLWDNTVRHYLTLEGAGKATNAQTRDVINSLRNLLVSALEGIVKDTVFLRKQKISLTRALITSKPADDAEAQAEAQAAKALVMDTHVALAKAFKAELPALVLKREQLPTHRRDPKRRRVEATSTEVVL